MSEKRVYAMAPEGCKDYIVPGKAYLTRPFYASEDDADVFECFDGGFSDPWMFSSWNISPHLNGGSWTRLELTEEEAEAINAKLSDPLNTHPDSDLDADQYSVGADTFPEDAADEIVKRAQKRNLNPYDAAGFLHAALGHMEDRKTTYDAPEGERSMGKTVAAFNAIAGHDLSEEEGWLFMVLLKAVRTQQGGFRADNYEDGAAYFGLQGEAAAKERGSE